MPVINGIEFFEDAQEPKSPRQRWAVDDGGVQRSLHIRDLAGGISEGQRQAAAQALIGYPTVQSGVGPSMQTWIARVLPDSYPTSVSPYLWATAIAGTDNLGPTRGVDISGAAIYTGCRFTVNYNLTRYQVKPDAEMIAPLGQTLQNRPDEGYWLARGWQYSRYVTRARKQGGEMLPIPGGYMRRVNGTADGATISAGLDARIAKATLRYTWHQVPVLAIPLAAQALCLNAVNNASFDGHAAGTLCLLDIEETIYPSGLGDYLADITYVMGWRPNFDDVDEVQKGWNAWMLPDDDTPVRYRYQYATSDGQAPDTINNTNTKYKYRDFTALFHPDQ